MIPYSIGRRELLPLLAAPLLQGREHRAQIAILGAGTGGCAAALAALRNGMTVVMTEETAWIGGQFTAQMVSAFDEHAHIETHGCTRAYRQFRNAIRDYYRGHYPLTDSARRRVNLNPGSGTVSNFAVEPRAVLAVLEGLLAPFVSGGQLRLLTRHKAVAADTDGERVRSVKVRNPATGNEHVLHADYFLDATELGDLLPLTKTEYVTGFESRAMTGEPSAPTTAQPANEQAITACFAVDYLHGEDHTISKPADYDFWRDYFPRLRPSWPDKLLSWKMSNPQTLQPRDLGFDPTLSQRGPGPLNLWLYRRIAARDNFTGGAYRSDISLINWPQNDYWLGRLIDVSEEEFARSVRGAKQLSLSLLYWMQTAHGWKGLRLREDIAGTEDGLAMYPYIRESRRIRAEFTVLEQHVSAKARGAKTAEVFADSAGTGSYRIDLHPTSGGDNYLDVASLPFQIPLGALIPRRVENLLAAAKNLGVTHITNGCYRLHPVEWNIGESAGALAAHCVRTRQPPRRVRNEKALLADFQALLERQGVALSWPG
ncbi:MAG: FAD-dependent oxidoreductase [Candidatus Solibacter usitatus]|nr:FAD-dependent oxidoreductase [Candidatus Solibacter usitatus]